MKEKFIIQFLLGAICLIVIPYGESEANSIDFNEYLYTGFDNVSIGEDGNTVTGSASFVDFPTASLYNGAFSVTSDATFLHFDYSLTLVPAYDYGQWSGSTWVDLGIWFWGPDDADDHMWFVDTLSSPYDPVSTTGSYRLPISQYQGQSIVLGWELVGPYPEDVVYLTLSNAYVSNQPIPEPTAMLLFGSGLAVLAGVIKRKKQ